MADTIPDKRSFLDPQLLARLTNLDLVARMVVEGFITGLHKSPFHGFSAEFSDHRPYMPGDPVRHIDWKVYAKSDRLFLKRYDEETNLNAYLLIDSSISMHYPEFEEKEDGLSKYTYALMLCASLAHLLVRQRDAVGSARFSPAVETLVPPRSTPAHLDAILSDLARGHAHESDRKTSLHPAESLHRLAERLKRRGLVIIVTDCFADEMDMAQNLELWASVLKHFRHQGHDVILFQIMTPQEMDLDFEGTCLFEGMETGRRLLADAWALKEDYALTVRGFLADLAAMCRKAGIDFQPMLTTAPLDMALFSYLSKRSRMR